MSNCTSFIGNPYYVVWQENAETFPDCSESVSFDSIDAVRQYASTLETGATGEEGDTPVSTGATTIVVYEAAPPLTIGDIDPAVAGSAFTAGFGLAVGPLIVIFGIRHLLLTIEQR